MHSSIKCSLPVLVLWHVFEAVGLKDLGAHGKSIGNFRWRRHCLIRGCSGGVDFAFPAVWPKQVLISHSWIWWGPTVGSVVSLLGLLQRLSGQVAPHWIASCLGGWRRRGCVWEVGSRQLNVSLVIWDRSCVSLWSWESCIFESNIRLLQLGSDKPFVICF